MNILIDLGNRLMSEALYELLARSGYDSVVVSRGPTANTFIPDVLLVDTAALSHGLRTEYLEAKVLLIDTGLDPEKLYATLLSHRIHGVLSPEAALQLLKEALKALEEGQLWIDNGSVKTLLHDAGDISRQEKILRVTRREQEIIDYICQGLGNREIARRLGLSEHSVKSHLNRIFTKLSISSRSKLMTLALKSRPSSG